MARGPLGQFTEHSFNSRVFGALPVGRHCARCCHRGKQENGTPCRGSWCRGRGKPASGTHTGRGMVTARSTCSEGKAHVLGRCRAKEPGPGQMARKGHLSWTGGCVGRSSPGKGRRAAGEHCRQRSRLGRKGRGRAKRKSVWQGWRVRGEGC